MSTQYESIKTATLYTDAFCVAAPASPVERNVWPRKPGVFIRAIKVDEAEEADDAEDAEEVQEVTGAEQPTRAMRFDTLESDALTSDA